ncbi:MAG: 50S ribosomal protein L25 [Patescibacteria group bacterium]
MELAVEKRDIKTSPKTLRNKGILPAVVYGRSEESTPISIDLKTFQKTFTKAGSSTVITLSGLGEDKDVLIQEVVTHAVSGAILHADFYAIEKGQKVTVSVPFEFDGESQAVKDGGILVKVMHELEMEVLPKELPHALHIDLSKLATLEDKITVKDIVLPASAVITDDGDEVVAMVTLPQEEVEETAIDISEIGDAVERGKKEEEAPAEGEEGAEEK